MRPELVQPVIEALTDMGLKPLESQDGSLKPRHVIVSSDFEGAVVGAIDSLRSSDRVKEKSRLVVTKSRQRPEQATDSELDSEDEEKVGTHAEAPCIIKRTFVDVPIQSSLWSGPSAGPKTVSTTDACARVGPNPRLTHIEPCSESPLAADS